MTAAQAQSSEVSFVARRQRTWDELDGIVREAKARGAAGVPWGDLARFSPLYRDVCADLSRAQAARYSGPLVDYLQGLTAAAHALLYGSRVKGWRPPGRSRESLLRAALEAFPRAVRRHKGFIALAFLLFFVPFFAAFFASLSSPTFAARVVPEDKLQMLVEAYTRGFDSGRGMGTDAGMAGYYIENNVGIALRCFATGLAGGLGSAFYLFQNGLMTGAIVGHVVARGAGNNILTFIVGHSSLELGAIVLAGGAGLSLGWSIVSPGERTRLASLQRRAADVSTVVFGAAVMLFLAAAVEGFWSGSAVPALVKRTVGGFLFLVVVAYVCLAGRGSQDGAEP